MLCPNRSQKVFSFPEFPRELKSGLLTGKKQACSDKQDQEITTESSAECVERADIL